MTVRTLSRFKRRRTFSLESLEGRQVLSTLFVSNLGNDKNAGTAAQPYLTIQKAANMAKPGDTVSVAPGNYAGFVLGWDTPQSGLPGKPITFSGQPGTNIVTKNAKTADGIDMEGSSWITIQGFNITGMGRAGIRTNNGTNITIQNNVCDKNAYWGIQTSFDNNLLIQNNVASNSVKQHGIYVGNTCSNPTVINNVIFGNKDCGLHMNGDVSQGGTGVITGAVVEGNIIYNNGTGGGAAINCDGVQNSLIANNMLLNNHHTGIVFFQQDAGGPSINDTVSNNTVIMASDSKNPALEFITNATGGTVKNNVLFVTTTKYPASLSITADCMPGFTSSNNAFNGYLSTTNTAYLLTLAKWQAATHQDMTSFATSTYSTMAFNFKNVAANDYSLVNSPIAGLGSQWLPVGGINLSGLLSTTTSSPTSPGTTTGTTTTTTTTGSTTTTTGSTTTTTGTTTTTTGTTTGTTTVITPVAPPSVSPTLPTSLPSLPKK